MNVWYVHMDIDCRCKLWRRCVLFCPRSSLCRQLSRTLEQRIEPTVDYWKLNDLTVASDVYKYFTGNPNGILSNGNGLIVKDAGKDSKLTFFVSYVSSDGSYSGYTTFTYYDIGYTSNELLDNYVASL